MKKLAALVSPEELFELDDGKDRLKTAIYMYKVETLISSHKTIQFCSQCLSVFSPEFPTECFNQIPNIDHTGRIVKAHTLDTSFDINEWVAAIHLTSSTKWPITFWK